MPRGRQKRPVVEPIRRKCEDTGTVKQVNYRHFTIPPVNTNMGTKSPTYNPNTPKKNREDIEGVIVRNYHTLEGAEAVHGVGSFTNNYTEDDFNKV
jgi:hypothetical protein